MKGVSAAGGVPHLGGHVGSLGLAGGLGGPLEQQGAVGRGAEEAGVGVSVHQRVNLQLCVIECVPTMDTSAAAAAAKSLQSCPTLCDPMAPQ